jgi:hypothetical protein
MGRKKLHNVSLKEGERKELERNLRKGKSLQEAKLGPGYFF